MQILEDTSDVGSRPIQADNKHIFAVEVGVFFHEIGRL
jgi:hypothetical protein